MQGFQDAFISYGRADSKTFAAKLNKRLLDLGFIVWFDFEDIPLGVDYQKQIDDGIEKADNFLYLIAPHSVNSPYCGLEIELALKRNKRIIPILHVEQISRETWQQRNPSGSDAEWEAYTVAGKHSSFPNMHPAISKINWIYMREELDDFEAGLEGLLKIFDRHRDYVHQHTVLLSKALEWERQQKRTPYLLIGEERLQAEDWLKVRFEDSQPPCLPTDLHCEFITESRKNADNLMTEVFIAYADEDREAATQLRNSLRRQGFTVWTNTTDIQAGADFEQVIQQGIEEADNVVYLLSPAAVASQWCQYELDYALSLHKRIIPVLAAATPPEQIPVELRSLQYIDLTDNTQTSDYQQDESQLLQVLHQNAPYHDTHKLLLTKALRWERQSQNPTLLLRGYNLQQAEAWLKVAQQNTAYPPLPIQETFITESLRQPPGLSLDVFVSYSRADSGFARRLNDALQTQGKRTWFDQESIAAGTADFQQEIHRGIESADIFLFILSPRSINSPYCAEEVEYAAKLNKRVVTVLHQPIDTASLHPELAKVQWLDFNRRERDFSGNFTELLRILDTDAEHLHAHTRLLLRAIEWEEKDRKESLLLRGDELEQGEQWLSQCAGKKPQPTELQQSYVHTSRSVEDARHQAEQILKAAAKKGKQLVQLGAIAGSVGLVVAGVASWFTLRAETRSNVADFNLEVTSAQQFLLTNQQLQALSSALTASNVLRSTLRRNGAEWQTLQPQAVAILQAATDWIRERNILDGHTDSVNTVQFSPDGTIVASGSDDNTLKLWAGESGEVIHSLVGHQDWITDISFSPDGKTIASGSADGTVKIWDVKTGDLIHTLQDHQAQVTQISFNPNGTAIASSSVDGTVKVWNINTGELIYDLSGHQGLVTDVSFSSDGKMIASGGEDKTIKVWNGNDGRLMYTLSGHQAEVSQVHFSPDAKLLASGSEDGTIRVWNTETGTLFHIFNGHQDSILDMSFSPDGKIIASASKDGTIQISEVQTKTVLHTLKDNEKQFTDIQFSPDGQSLAAAGLNNTIRLWNAVTGAVLYDLKGHQDGVLAISFRPDGTTLASASKDRTIRIWDVDHGVENHKILGKHNDKVLDIRYSPDGQTIASSSADHTIKLWGAETGAILHTLAGHENAITTINFSPDGKTIVSSSVDKSIKFWDIKTGKTLRTLSLTGGAMSFTFSPDGKTIASANRDNNIQLWTVETGSVLRTLEGHQDLITDLRFSPDGKTIASSSLDNTVKLWDRESGAILQSFEEPEGGINGISFSPDGKVIAASSDDYMIWIWDVTNRTLRYRLKGHRDRVNKISFSPDSTTIVSGSWDNTIKFWDTKTGKMFHSISVYPDIVQDLRFAPDGRSIVSGSWRGTVMYWTWDLDRLTAIGCDWIQPYLTSRPDQQTVCDISDS